MSFGEEKRQHPRVPLAVKVTHVKAGVFAYFFSRDLSMGGMFLETREPYKVGTELDLDFHLPETQGRILVSGKVVRVVEPVLGSSEVAPGMGVNFTELPPESEKKLIAFLKKTLADS